MSRKRFRRGRARRAIAVPQSKQLVRSFLSSTIPFNTLIGTKTPAEFVRQMGFDPEKPTSSMAPEEFQLWKKVLGVIPQRAQEIMQRFAGKPVEDALRFMGAELELARAADIKVRAAKQAGLDDPANRQAYAKAAYEMLPHAHSYIATRVILARLFLDRVLPQMPEEQKMRFLFTLPETLDILKPNQYRLHARKMIRAERQAMPRAGVGHVVGVRSAAQPQAAAARGSAPLQTQRAVPIKPGTREERLAGYMNGARAGEKPRQEQKKPSAQPRLPAEKVDMLELTLRELHRRRPQTAVALMELLREGVLSGENAKLLAARSSRVQRIFLRVCRDPGFLREFEYQGINELAAMLCKIGGVGKKEPEVAKLFGSRGEEILGFLIRGGFASLHGHDKVVYLNRI